MVLLLQQRGMNVEDPIAAERFLTRVNYYKFKAYLYKFEAPHPTLDHHYSDETSFQEVYRIYKFDRKLRLLICDMLERFEIAVRTKWAQELSQKRGAFAHEEPANFKNPNFHFDSLALLKNSYRRSPEKFAKHFKNNYPRMVTPYIWVSVEMMSFGEVSRWLSNTRDKKLRQNVAQSFGFKPAFFESYVHRASDVRNICSHHQRIWDRRLPTQVKPLVSSTFDSSLLNADPAQADKLYNFLAVLSFIADEICPGHKWNDRLVKFLDIDNSRVHSMGFPSHWRRAFKLST